MKNDKTKIEDHPKGQSEKIDLVLELLSSINSSLETIKEYLRP